MYSSKPLSVGLLPSAKPMFHLPKAPVAYPRSLRYWGRIFSR